MRTWIPGLYATAGCAALTWLDAHALFLLFPLAPAALVLLLPLVPLRWEGLRQPWRTLPLGLAAGWMLLLPHLPTGEVKRFFLTAEGLARGMSAAEVRARMDPFVEIGRDDHWRTDESEWYPAPGPEVLVFLSGRRTGQVCQVFLAGDRVTRVELEYVD